MKVMSENDLYLKKLEEQKKDRIAVKQAQLEALDNVYDRKLKETKEDAESEIDLEKIKQHEEFLKTVSEGEEKLSNYKNEVNKTLKALEDSKENSIEFQKAQAKKITDNYADKLVELNDETSRHIETRLNESNRAIDDTKTQTRKTIQQSQTDGIKQINALTTQHEKKFKEEDIKYRDVRGREELQFYKDMAKSRLERERILKEQFDRTANQASTVEATHQKKISDLEANYNKLYEQKETLFQERFKMHQDANEAYLTRLKDQFNKDLKEITESHTKKKELISDKTQDEFYHMRLLEPQITEGEKFYTLEVKLPDHERESVILNAFDRTMRLSLSRRFSDELAGPAGERDITKRSELISREFFVKDILDPNKISQKYENGTLTFKVAKK